MCGLAGILGYEGGADRCRERLGRMAALLRHRGPDDVGFHLDAHVGLAHRRLSILDLEGGRQPIYNEDGDICVVFNGEIFNFQELRRHLIAGGHRFRTQSDTEVIVHLYEDHGVDFVGHLNGQFAIALWDARRHQLVLARDRFGIRPLFYARSGRELLFASEIKSLFAAGALPRRLDLDTLGQVFTYWAPLAERTAFADVMALPPGHLLTIEAGRCVQRRYWDWCFPISGSASADAAGRAPAGVREALVEAVKLQLHADVPVGVYLSGGLDSTIVALLARKCSPRSLTTFSISFGDGEYDESTYQREVAQALGTEHHEYRCTHGDIGRALPTCIWHLETPVLRTAPVPMMLLAARVHEAGFKVVLTGEGADEVFGGYDIFREEKIRRFWARDPLSKLRPKLLTRLYPYMRRSPTAVLAYSQLFFGQGMNRLDEPIFGHLPRWHTTRKICRFLDAGVRESMQMPGDFDDLKVLLPDGVEKWEPLSRTQYIEAQTLLSGYILSSQGDRVAMAHSVEGRYPFLDNAVVDYATTLPARLKIRGLAEKYVLKESVRDLVPARILDRPKQPYRAPEIASFIRDGDPLDYVAELFSPSRLALAGYFDSQAAGKLFEKCRRGLAKGAVDNMAFVGILSTMLLDDLYIRDSGGMFTASISKNTYVAAR